MIRSILKKKEKGQADLIASLFVLLALTLFVLLFINSIGDVNTRIQIDQVARKYILRMESSGELTSTEKTAIEKDLLSIMSVKKAVTAGNDINITWSSDKGENQKGGYGGTITLKIECPAMVTTYKTDTGVVGTLSRNTPAKYVVTKQSTAKY